MVSDEGGAGQGLTGPLAGVRVVDLAGPAGALATRELVEDHVLY